MLLYFKKKSVMSTPDLVNHLFRISLCAHGSRRDRKQTLHKLLLQCAKHTIIKISLYVALGFVFTGFKGPIKQKGVSTYLLSMYVLYMHVSIIIMLNMYLYSILCLWCTEASQICSNMVIIGIHMYTLNHQINKLWHDFCVKQFTQ